MSRKVKVSKLIELCISLGAYESVLGKGDDGLVELWWVNGDV